MLRQTASLIRLESDSSKAGSWRRLVYRHWIGVGVLAVAGVMGVHAAVSVFALPAATGAAAAVAVQWMILLGVLTRAGVMIRRRSAVEVAATGAADGSVPASSPQERTRAFAQLSTLVRGRLLAGLPVSRRRIGRVVGECLRAGGRNFFIGLDDGAGDRQSANIGIARSASRIIGQEARVGKARRVAVIGLVLLLSALHVHLGLGAIALGIEGASATIDPRDERTLGVTLIMLNAAFLAVLCMFAPLELFPTGELSAEVTPRDVRVRRLLGWSTFGHENSVRVIIADPAGLRATRGDPARGISATGVLLLSPSGDIATLTFAGPGAMTEQEFLAATTVQDLQPGEPAPAPESQRPT